ncbi:uncharacterized protein LOC119098592 [Pollicipes pollicipes]|uniref:uncharacterized protein LOC119098592 n=1 Tax=Pollicipes pollicipes TaxID=41117 RepID=UPI001885079A|nr:uncharacterized protein LOC119098592 [Pollicipes pollicipes]XP_037077454.1 uncharacterized protein LOC119098592 [Pollicipes pollicipes]XP_037077455.1 uncharacterized protein LOC119098592 [Pollicipes pollicipes]XP_037077456.1 uncharacterized protein LOC119098592 [Pollicipes pollicipes]XP_037077457.1 uncharacterized protein LOC119098592 [Pollicipes pollicipes]XP_037077459.1 uncharacterized protein LOC119098592 [Pollicipes pollicipes]
MDADSVAPRKLLLSSPSQQAEQQAQERGESADQSRHWFEQEVEKNLADSRQEDHLKRLRKLKKALDYISETDWKYENAKPF